MKKQIAVLPGDGIGPEVTTQAVKALEAVSDHFKHHFDYVYAHVGAIAIDLNNDPLPEATLGVCTDADAVLFGAIGHPKYDNDPTAKIRPEQGLLRLRKSLGLYANVRPVTTYSSLAHLSPLKDERIEGVDMVILRELTGDLYFGEKGRSEDRNRAYDIAVYERYEIERIAEMAFDYARKRRKKVTLVDKANVLETSRLWREVVGEMAKSHPDIELDYLFVDNAAMQLIQYPAQFDVMLTSNMFGDILSDEASVIAGSMGLLPSASYGAKTALFEPIHGSYPQAAGLDIANPAAAILSAAMLLDYFNLIEEANAIRKAVQYLLERGIGTPDLKPAIPCSCSQFGDLVYCLIAEPEYFKSRAEKMIAQVSTII